MTTAKSAFHSIVERIKDKSIFEIKPLEQKNKKKLDIQKIEFNDKIVNEYFKDINLILKNLISYY